MNTNCNCPQIPDECIPQPLIPICSDPEYCEDVLSDKCIVHTGNTLSNIGSVTGDRLESILQKIDNKVLTNTLTAEKIIEIINSSAELKAAIRAL